MRSVDNTEHKQAGNLRGMELKTFIADICQLILPTLCPSSEVPDASLRLKSTHMYAHAEYGQIEMIHGMKRRNFVISLQKTYSWGIKTVVKKKSKKSCVSDNQFLGFISENVLHLGINELKQ